MGIRVEKYSNERLRARKARILQEARNLIGTKGVDGLTMRELADKSGVALATLYNIYGSKDVLVSYAVNDFFEKILETGVVASPGKTTLERMLGLLDLIAKQVRKQAAYTRVVVTLYFKLDSDMGIHNMLYKIAITEFTELLEEMRAEADYHDWVSVELLADEISEQLLLRIFQWVRGGVPDAHLADVIKFSVLQLLVGATRGTVSTTIHTHLAKLARKLARVRSANAENSARAALR